MGDWKSQNPGAPWGGEFKISKPRGPHGVGDLKFHGGSQTLPTIDFPETLYPMGDFLCPLVRQLVNWEILFNTERIRKVAKSYEYRKRMWIVLTVLLFIVLFWWIRHSNPVKAAPIKKEANEMATAISAGTPTMTTCDECRLGDSSGSSSFLWALTGIIGES